MEFLYLFLKIFGLLIVMFILVMIFFVYPTNILYNNTEYKQKGDAGLLLIWSIIVICLINSLLYYYYNFGTSYLCTVTKYISCSPGSSYIAVYVLLFIHLLITFAFSYLFTNKLYEDIKSKKLDIYLFSYATLCIFLTLLNYKIYNNLYLNQNILYLFVKILLYLVTFSPIYSYLIINLVIKHKPKKKKKKKKK